MAGAKPVPFRVSVGDPFEVQLAATEWTMRFGAPPPRAAC